MKTGILEYFHDLRRFIRFSLQLFILSVVAGIYIAEYHEKEMQEVLNRTAAALSSGMGLSGFSLFYFIFENNVTTLFYALLASVVFGLSSVTMIIVNGIIAGVFMILVVKKTSFLVFIMGIVPHGIFEIPAAVISSSMGMKIGWTVILKLRRKKVSIGNEIYSALKYFFLIVVPLLFIAAIIEAFVTLTLISLVIKQ